VLAALPFGGYVKMLDEREGPLPQGEDLSRAFNRQSIWKRIAIVAAGPAANLLLAIFLYWCLFLQGTMGIKPVLGEVPENSPAAIAGMQAGQQIHRIGDIPTPTWQDVRWVLLQQTLESASIEVETKLSTGTSQVHQLDLSGIGSDDYEGDFLGKLGLRPFQSEVPAIIGDIVKNSPAMLAGLQSGDRVLAVNSTDLETWEQFVNIARQSPDHQLQIRVLRNDRLHEVLVTPESVTDAGEAIGRIGAMGQIDEAL